ncbi:MAG: acyloxyacyl hydrolase, partial [Acidobacteria bacterium]|nr:acyloxyacyl hydrolase [Acidobacteriota bacterium]
LAPNFAVSLYEQGDGKDLGHEIEFRSGLELACSHRGGSSLGLEFYHISNSSISDVNPGSNSLLVYYSWPLGR